MRVKANKDNSKSYKYGLKEDLVQIDMMLDNEESSSDILTKRMEVLNSLRDLDKLDAMELAQKAKIKWAIEGDENSNRFDKPLKYRLHIDMDFPNKLSLDQQADLENNITREEIKKAVWDCGVDKSPGPDGFTFGFYRRYWTFLENDVVDFEKAYDLVRWDYLDDILKKFGFGEKWCGWIRNCLLSSKGSVIVNGSPTKEFQFHRGLKHGYPLSPFLVILIMECLHISMQRVVDAGLFRGSKVGCLMSRIQSWNGIVNIILARLPKWKMKTLSIGGRLTILKYVLENGIHTMSFCNGIEHNGKKQIWVKWNKVLSSKEKGGLGVSSFYALNRALLFKWVWRFRTQQLALWTKVIKWIHGEDGKLGNVEDTRFWEDKWRGDNTFKSDYPRMYALETQKNVSVASKISHADILCSFRRAPRGGVEESQFFQLVKNVEGVTFVDMKDRWRWSLEGCGDFSVASVRKVLDDSLLPIISSKTRWIKAVPIKTYFSLGKLGFDSYLLD
ncbi:RNA-directed DNA polymerase, eukaryota, reverse transcriptase zinc-binding domain protein [Tanacetum coccineum]|uniref:RNA-directed DNA polymerase, eukaryota, reverse transcriptase zinc-binding domain protein n=1 Tax=Tanacetum coccineum TaxID=301880 RepID=A0ABQ5AFR5_9ASTR